MPVQPDIRRPRPIFINLSPTIQGMDDLSEYALSIHTRKTLGASAGTWEVTLLPAPNASGRVSRLDFQSVIYQAIRPMDAVLLGAWGQGFDDNDVYSQQHFMFGFVDNVYKTKTQVNGRIQRSVTVRGRDATKLFLVDNIANAPELATSPEVQKVWGDNKKVLQFLDYIRGMTADGKNIFADSTLNDAVMWILANAPSMQITLDHFGGGTKTPYEIFQTYLMSRKEDKVFDFNMNMYAGSVLNYFVSLIDSMFYELWIDTLPYNSPNNATGITRPCLIMRPKPYDYRWEKINSKGEALFNQFIASTETPPTEYNWQSFIHPITVNPITIHDEDILDMGLGISDEEIFSMYKVGGRLDVIATSQLGTYGFNFPLLDANLVKAYGLRELIADSKLLPSSTDSLSQLFPNSEPDIARSERKIFADAWDIPFLGTVQNSLNITQIASDIANSKKDKLAQNSAVRSLTLEKRDRLWRWNRNNHILESGRATIKGRNAFVGTKIVMPDEFTHGVIDEASLSRTSNKGMEFYCTSVDQQVGWGRAWTTSIALTRGANMKELEQYYRTRNWDKPAGEANQIFAKQSDGVK